MLEEIWMTGWLAFVSWALNQSIDRTMWKTSVGTMTRDALNNLYMMVMSAALFWGIDATFRVGW